MNQGFRVTGSYVSKTRSYKGLWTVPSLSGHSMLFCSNRWYAAVAYAMCRNNNVGHRDAVVMARRATPELRMRR